MKQPPPSIEEVFKRVKNFDGLVARCPHCGYGVSFQQVHQGPIETRLAGSKASRLFSVGRCPSCYGIVVGQADTIPGSVTREGIVIWPIDEWPDNAPEDLGSDIKSKYDEGRSIISLSPSAAAVMARRCLQQVIRTKLAITRRKLFDEIEDAIKSGELSKPTAEALHHVREIGNWGAHPCKDESLDPVDVMLEVTRADAEYTFQALEMCFHDLYVMRKQLTAMNQRITGTTNASAKAEASTTT